LLRILVAKIKSRPILVQDVTTYLENNLNLLKINEGYHKEEGYLKSLKNDKISNKRMVNSNEWD